MRLSANQLRMLRVIHRIEQRWEVATDAEGDLSICSRNAPATEDSLVRRGLVSRRWIPEGLYVPEGYYEYNTTVAGRAVLAATNGGAA